VLLFVRAKAGVRLTPEGACLLPEARRLLRHLDALKRDARQLGAGDSGTVLLGCVSAAAYNTIPALLPAFHRRYPGIKLRLQEATSDLQLAALGRGEIDAGLLLPPIDDAAIGYLPVFRDKLVAALPTSPTGREAFAQGARISLRRLAASAFILFPRKAAPGLYDSIIGACREAGFSPRIEQEAIEMQTIVSLVAAGMGVTLVPASLARLRRAGVVYKPFVERSPTMEIGLAWRADHVSPALRVLIEFVTEMVRKT